MQRGIIKKFIKKTKSLAKEVWQTVKNELIGPKVLTKEIKSGKRKIASLDIKEKKVKTHHKNAELSVGVNDLTEDSKPEIKCATFKAKVLDVKTLKDNTVVSERDIIIKDFNATVHNFKVKKPTTLVYKKKFKYNVQSIVKKRDYKLETKVLKATDKIYLLPQIFKGKSTIDFYKSDLEQMLRKIKMKFPKKNLTHYKIEMIFENIAEENVKEIVYNREERSLRVFLKASRIRGKLRDCVVLRNKESNLSDKIFI